MVVIKLLIVFLIIISLSLIVFDALTSLIISGILTGLVAFVFKPLEENYKNKKQKEKKLKEKLTNGTEFLAEKIDLADEEVDLLTKVNKKEQKKINDLTLYEETDKEKKIIDSVINKGERTDLLDTSKTIVVNEIGKTVPLQKQDISFSQKDLEVKAIEELQEKVITLEDELETTNNEFKRYIDELGVDFDQDDDIPEILEKLREHGKDILGGEHKKVVKKINESPFILMNGNKWINQSKSYSKGCKVPTLGDLNAQYLDISKTYKNQEKTTSPFLLQNLDIPERVKLERKTKGESKNKNEN
jgi:hypothetical protein